LLASIKYILVLLPVSLVFLELLLRLTINLWPVGFKTLLLCRFGYGPSDIFFFDSLKGIEIMKPNFYQPKMFFNDYWWSHRTNSIAIRDDKDIERADIVALGDSMVYGQGLNFENTICYYLEKSCGLRVANLGIQGDYPPISYIRLRDLGLFLKPKIVLFFINGGQDKSDLDIYAITKDYINKITSAQPPDYSKGLACSDYLEYYHRIMKKSLRWRVFDDLFIYRLYGRGYSVLSGFIKYKWRQKFMAEEQAAGPKDLLYYIMNKTITATSILCKLNNTKLIVVFHPTPNKPDIPNNMCKKICSEKNILFFDLSKKKPLADYFIKNDGLYPHYTPQGAKWVADSIFEYLKKTDLL
jgi:hypothetical protein